MSERRHRLFEDEIPEVVKGLLLRLKELLEMRENRGSAEIAFRTLYRLNRKKPGRPKYPEFSWDFMDYYVEHYEPEED